MTKEYSKTTFWWVVAVTIACMVILWPLFRPGFFVSDDGDWMIIRLSAFFQSFREGQFPVRFLGRLNNSYGYPVANFLYPGFLYLGSMFHALGFSFVDSVKIIFVGSIIIASLFIFFWLRRFFTHKASFMGTLAYIFGPYLLFDVYKRGSVGEVLAIAVAAMGLYSIEASAYWLLPLVVGFLLVSHNSLALLFLCVFWIYIISRKKWKLLGATVLGIGMATFFWFPALYERRYVIFDSVGIARPSEYFVHGSTIALLGFSNILACVLLLIRKKTNLASFQKAFIVLFIASVILATQLSAPLWSSKILVSFVQFPFRFLSVALLLGPWIVAYVVEKKYVSYGPIIFGLLWIGVAVPMTLAVRQTTHPEGYYTTNEATTTVQNEYMPRWVARIPGKRPDQRVEFYQGQGSIYPRFVSTQRVDVDIDVKEESIIQINTIYYPGWGVVIDDRYIAPRYGNPEGLIHVPVSPGEHRLIAEFRETIPRFIADVVSAASFLFYIIYIVIKKKKTTLEKRL